MLIPIHRYNIVDGEMVLAEDGAWVNYEEGYVFVSQFANALKYEVDSIVDSLHNSFEIQLIEVSHTLQDFMDS
jgi:hypothetical protein